MSSKPDQGDCKGDCCHATLPGSKLVVAALAAGKDAPSTDRDVYQRRDGSHQTEQRICSTLWCLG